MMENTRHVLAIALMMVAGCGKYQEAVIDFLPRSATSYHPATCEAYTTVWGDLSEGKTVRDEAVLQKLSDALEHADKTTPQPEYQDIIVRAYLHASSRTDTLCLGRRDAIYLNGNYIGRSDKVYAVIAHLYQRDLEYP